MEGNDYDIVFDVIRDHFTTKQVAKVVDSTLFSDIVIAIWPPPPEYELYEGDDDALISLPSVEDVLWNDDKDIQTVVSPSDIGVLAEGDSRSALELRRVNDTALITNVTCPVSSIDIGDECTLAAWWIDSTSTAYFVALKAWSQRGFMVGSVDLSSLDTVGVSVSWIDVTEVGTYMPYVSFDYNPDGPVPYLTSADVYRDGESYLVNLNKDRGAANGEEAPSMWPACEKGWAMSFNGTAWHYMGSVLSEGFVDLDKSRVVSTSTRTWKSGTWKFRYLANGLTEPGAEVHQEYLDDLSGVADAAYGVWIVIVWIVAIGTVAVITICVARSKCGCCLIVGCAFFGEKPKFGDRAICLSLEVLPRGIPCLPDKVRGTCVRMWSKPVESSTSSYAPTTAAAESLYPAVEGSSVKV